MIRASEVHHKYAGSDRSAHYLDESTWMAVCPICHRQIHDEGLYNRGMDFIDEGRRAYLLRMKNVDFKQYLLELEQG